jgi:hypothetical protein
MLHVLKRLLLMAVGYLAAVPVGLISMVAVYFVLSALPDAPEYFAWVSISPLVVVAAPAVGVFVLIFAVILTGLPSFVAALLAELFSLRRLWLFGPLGAVMATGAFIYVSPLQYGPADLTDWLDLAIVALGGFSGGVTYWLIAGRNAGFSRDRQPLAAAAVPR